VGNMKKISISFVIALLIAGQLFTLVAAAAPSAGLASTNCGDTYVVQRGDYLARIARNCGTTVANILAHNPQIWNPNLIYGGMVLNLTGSVNPPPPPVVYYNPNQWYGNFYYPGGWWYGGYYNPTPNRTYTTPRVSLSTTSTKAGKSVTVYVSGFPANTEIDYRVGQQGKNWVSVYDGRTGSNGSDTMTITIPSSAKKGQNWVVHVLTTEGHQGAQAYSSLIYING
jgi:LysM repeat protein